MKLESVATFLAMASYLPKIKSSACSPHFSNFTGKLNYQGVQWSINEEDVGQIAQPDQDILDKNYTASVQVQYPGTMKVTYCDISAMQVGEQPPVSWFYGQGAFELDIIDCYQGENGTRYTLNGKQLPDVICGWSANVTALLQDNQLSLATKKSCPETYSPTQEPDYNALQLFANQSNQYNDQCSDFRLEIPSLLTLVLVGGLVVGTAIGVPLSAYQKTGCFRKKGGKGEESLLNQSSGNKQSCFKRCCPGSVRDGE